MKKFFEATGTAGEKRTYAELHESAKEAARKLRVQFKSPAAFNKSYRSYSERTGSANTLADRREAYQRYVEDIEERSRQLEERLRRRDSQRPPTPQGLTSETQGPAHMFALGPAPQGFAPRPQGSYMQVRPRWEQPGREDFRDFRNPREVPEAPPVDPAFDFTPKYHEDHEEVPWEEDPFLKGLPRPNFWPKPGSTIDPWDRDYYGF